MYEHVIQQLNIYPEANSSTVENQQIFQPGEILEIENMEALVISEDIVLLSVLSKNQLFIYINDLSIQLNNFEHVKTITLQYDILYEEWEESLKFEKSIYRSRAEFFAKQYKKNFGYQPKEELKVLEYQLITDKNNEDEEMIGLIVGGHLGLIYIINISNCIYNQDQNNQKTVQSYFQLHMNTITDIKAMPVNNSLGVNNIIVSGSKDGLIKITNVYTETVLGVLQEILSPYPNAQILSVNWSADGKNVIASNMSKSIHIWKISDELNEIIANSNKSHYLPKFKLPYPQKSSQFWHKNIHNDQINIYPIQTFIANNWGAISFDSDGTLIKWDYNLPSEENQQTIDQNLNILCVHNDSLNTINWDRKVAIDQFNQWAYLGDNKGNIKIYILDEIFFQQHPNSNNFQNKHIHQMEAAQALGANNSHYIKLIKLPQNLTLENNNNNQAQDQFQPGKFNFSYGFAATVNSIIIFPLIENNDQ
ncbi:WD40-repeat-containing domain [Pseudocohnilembus persalinus]|uniref:WD40-repeat-containing domain n=1 Tax=Pseudocohnilembus persalinus TaxID=266149 RepID=A0A0V0R369_PSEPJ|nr:WD40-repeat-containing domain [Pseudocohnilembus persalinus]|eukprot:KRX08939.1 WD40-repeat-containing domain [Pseudocohnilembus persalinus]